MPAYYSVIQYVPDLVRDERMNVGIVAIENDRIGFHFVDNLKRVRDIGGDPEFVADFAGKVQTVGAKVVRLMIERWDRSIRFTKPAASLLDFDSAIYDAATRFLIDPVEPRKGYRTRYEIIGLAKRSLKSALTQVAGNPARRFVKSTTKVDGVIDTHCFDVAVQNGELLYALDALSFEIPQQNRLEEVVKATAWSIDDVKDTRPRFKIAVAVTKPKDRSTLFDRAVHTFSELGATVVHEEELDEWSNGVAEAVKQHLPISPR